MSGVWLWLHASWKLVVPALAVAQAAVMVNVAPVDGVPLGWRVDWAWMLSVWSGATLLVSPVAAAAVVALVLLNLGPEVQAGLPATVQRWRPVFQLAAAVAIQGFAVQALGLAFGAVVCASNQADASGVTLPWQLVTGPAALAAAVSVGAAVALLLPSYWSIPGVLFGLFAAHRVFYWQGYPELFTTEMATWLVSGGRPIPGFLISTVGLNLAVAIAVVSGTVFVTSRRGFRPWPALVLCVIAGLAAVAIYVPYVAAGAMDTYEPLR